MVIARGVKSVAEELTAQAVIVIHRETAAVIADMGYS